MAFDTWFGFDLIQRKTLEKKLAALEEAAALIAAIPTTDPGDSVTIWNNAGVLELASTI